MKSVPTLGDRTSGVLLHPTSLPGQHGSGDLGPGARAFVDFLVSSGQSWWQTLPVAPVGYANSPYSAQSSFAGNPMLIAFEPLVERGLLDRDALEHPPAFPVDHVDFAAAPAYRERLRRLAFERYIASGKKARRALDDFADEHASWAPDFALYRALKRARGESTWTSWEPDLRDRKKRALTAARDELAGEIAFYLFEQHEFEQQWHALRAYANEHGVGLIGDVPIFVAHDSADVWQHRELFRLDATGNPTVVAGVPPDYFSKTGQLWGNPLYRWSRMQKGGFGWWLERMGITLGRFDAVRLDHFIGFYRYWEIPAGSPTAENGRYVRAPGAELFRAFRKRFRSLPLIAEDLGNVTPEVKALRDRFELPGIKVLQFAFGTDPSAPDFLPHNYVRRGVVYTGTHDNDTVVGWFNERPGAGSTRTEEQVRKEREIAMQYLASDGREIHWDMVRMAWLSVANVAVVPAQDLLGLGTEARMNLPARADGNWEWRVAPGALDARVAERLGALTRCYDRARRPEPTVGAAP